MLIYIRKKTFFFFLALSLFCPFVDAHEERRVPSRPLPLEILHSLEKEKEAEDAFVSSRKESVTKTHGSSYPRNFPGSHHWFAGYEVHPFKPDLFNILLEDGSEWEPSPLEAHITSFWESIDDIFIVKNKKNSFYSYSLVNKDKGSKCDVNMFLTPFPLGTYTYTIAYIDRQKNKLFIRDSDGYLFSVKLSKWDKTVLTYWIVGDIIVTGVNFDWLEWWNPYIFINADTLTHARGSLKK